MDNLVSFKSRLNRLWPIVLFLASSLAHAEVTMTEAWVRATAPGQTVGAAYATLTATQAMTLVQVDTDRADAVELHSMTMKNGIMKMRSLKQIALPANQAVKLAPGGLHLMLMGLSKPLKAGEQAKFTFHFLDANGQMQMQTATLPIKAPE